MLAVWGFLETIGGVYEGLRGPQERPQVAFIVSNPKGSSVRGQRGATRKHWSTRSYQVTTYTPLRLLHSHLHNHDPV
jgi:hypothetical protein